jgi:hypothetical protein
LATATAARERRRLEREQRRDSIVGSGEQPAEPSPAADSGSEAKTADDSVRERVRQTPPSVAALVGAAAGLLIGVAVGQRTRNRGNEISGDVAVYLLKKIELLTIKLQARQARRGGRAEIDVHRAEGS